MKNKKLLKFLTSLNLDIDFSNIDLKGITNLEDLTNTLTENDVLDVEIIYYSVAIEYLKDNDASLNSSLELANNEDYELSNLNSEKLASLLASKNLRISYDEISNEIKEFFESSCNDCDENILDCECVHITNRQQKFLDSELIRVGDKLITSSNIYTKKEILEMMSNFGKLMFNM